jgi:hypothetical protein
MSPTRTVLVVVDVSVVVVVLVVVDVEVVGTVVVVVVGGSHGHCRSTGTPTVAFKHTSASVADVGSVPFGAQIQAGSQLCRPTAALRMNKQSVATGAAPALTGWEQSPVAARAGSMAPKTHTSATASAARRHDRISTSPYSTRRHSPRFMT